MISNLKFFDQPKGSETYGKSYSKDPLFTSNIFDFIKKKEEDPDVRAKDLFLALWSTEEFIKMVENGEAEDFIERFEKEQGSGCLEQPESS